MEKEKQIEEMANFLWHNTLIHTEDLCHDVAESLVIAGYRKASEVARGIFAEIEKLMLDGEIGGKYPAKVINPDKYAELKKKYTEN